MRSTFETMSNDGMAIFQSSKLLARGARALEGMGSSRPGEPGGCLVLGPRQPLRGVVSALFYVQPGRPDPRDQPLEHAEEADAVQDRVHPADRDAVVPVVRCGVMLLM